MKEKRKAATWYLAATHLLTAGFVIPFFVGVISGFLVAASGIPRDGMLATLINQAFSLFAVWQGVIYSARFIKKRYEIIDSHRLVKLATIYYVVLSGISFVGIFFLTITTALSGDTGGREANFLIESVLVQAISAVLFYWISTRELDR